MAQKAPLPKANSIESVSTGLTYLALTGAFLTPLITATGPLPPAIEAKAEDTAKPAKATQEEIKASKPDTLAAANDKLQSVKASDAPGGEDEAKIALPKRPTARRAKAKEKTAMKAETPAGASSWM